MPSSPLSSAPLTGARPARRSVADRAGRCLRHLLAWRARADERVEAVAAPHRASLLCPGGFFAEQAFVFAPPGRPAELRYTAEVDDPGRDTGLRLKRARRLVRELGAKAPDPDAIDRLHAIQRGHALRFGAWVGGRHRSDGEAFKLYAEVPVAAGAQAARWLEASCGMRPSLLDGARLELVGLKLGGAGRLEFYGSLCPMHPQVARRLFVELGFEARWPVLWSLVEDLRHTPSRRRLLCADMGFSVSVDPVAGAPVALSLFAASHAAFANDLHARNSLLGLARRRGWQTAGYAAATPVVDERSEDLHTIITLKVGRDAAAAVGVGIAATELVADLQGLNRRQLDDQDSPSAPSPSHPGVDGKIARRSEPLESLGGRPSSAPPRSQSHPTAHFQPPYFKE